MSKRKRGSRHYMLTHYNYDQKNIHDKYANKKVIPCYAYQEEICPNTKTPHIQGYVEFKNAKTLSAVKKYFDDKTLHIEQRAGTKTQAVEYCTKEESRKPGTQPHKYNCRIKSGSRPQFDLHITHLMEHKMSLQAFRKLYPKYYLQHYQKILDIRRQYKQEQRFHQLVESYKEIELRPWQKQVQQLFNKQDDRTILWVYDPPGNQGKTLLAKYLYCLDPENTLIIRGGQIKDIAEAYTSESNVIFDFGKSVDQYISYRALEQIKDGSLTKIKYKSRMVLLTTNKVLVLSNEKPDINLLSLDRWQVYNIQNGLLHQEYPIKKPLKTTLKNVKGYHNDLPEDLKLS